MDEETRNTTDDTTGTLAESDTVASNGHLAVMMADDEDLSGGTWITLRSGIPGLDVFLCPFGTKEGRRLTASAVRKFGGPRDNDINSLKPAKQDAAVGWVMARAYFKSFRSPVGDPGTLEICGPTQKKGEGRLFHDNPADRESLVLDYMPLREALDAEIKSLGEAEAERMEDAAGN